jgi:hypothetical protein
MVSKVNVATIGALVNLVTIVRTGMLVILLTKVTTITRKQW